MASSLSRTVGPLLGGIIFGWGLDSGVVGTVWWGYLLVISVGGLAWSWTLKEGEHPAARKKPENIEMAVSPTPSTMEKYEDNPDTERR